MDDLNRHIKELLQDPEFNKAWQESERDYRMEKIKINNRLRKKVTLKTFNPKSTVTGSHK
ncbi:hypothetical protein [Desulfoscipio gibsoniae]|uniref:Uncharacterized protein n=1 Tax=Desulfoscipio gibsoniae DSM 7213 TaxID=767817 RepID=R4KLK4_9FIRM|nr:hypothetical protein [Desulfoscipio gibsoniae]AGL01440.1 hypothetical protein Desgi_1997 [Desulfoscipio gibsoniae DSM 7213]